MEGKENETGVSPGQGVSEGRGSGKALLSLNRTLESLFLWRTCKGIQDPRGQGSETWPAQQILKVEPLD